MLSALFLAALAQTWDYSGFASDPPRRFSTPAAASPTPAPFAGRTLPDSWIRDEPVAIPKPIPVPEPKVPVPDPEPESDDVVVSAPKPSEPEPATPIDPAILERIRHLATVPGLDALGTTLTPTVAPGLPKRWRLSDASGQRWEHEDRAKLIEWVTRRNADLSRQNVAPRLNQRESIEPSNVPIGTFNPDSGDRLNVPIGTFRHPARRILRVVLEPPAPITEPFPPGVLPRHADDPRPVPDDPAPAPVVTPTAAVEPEPDPRPQPKAPAKMEAPKVRVYASPQSPPPATCPMGCPADCGCSVSCPVGCGPNCPRAQTYPTPKPPYAPVTPYAPFPTYYAPPSVPPAYYQAAPAYPTYPQGYYAAPSYGVSGCANGQCGTSGVSTGFRLFRRR